MAQPFECLCGKPSCRGTVAGAKDMSPAQLQGTWLNGHIHDLTEEQSHGAQSGNGSDPTARALRDALGLAEKVVDAARLALRTYLEATPDGEGATGNAKINGSAGYSSGLGRRGLTSRELSGEMGGDTVVG